jgi:1,4-alpha-glucan branching enzyme
LYYNKLVASIDGDTSNKMMMAISHDEIGSSPLIDMTPGLTESQKCANLRALFSLQMCLPGKKLGFMGSEVGSSVEWKKILGKKQGLLNEGVSEERLKIQKAIAALSKLYKDNPSLWTKDSNARDLEWIEKNDPAGSFIGYRRKLDDQSSLACFHNFSATKSKTYKVLVPEGIDLSIAFNSDDEQFGGSGNRVKIVHSGHPNGNLAYEITVPPLSALVLKEKRLVNKAVRA